MKLEEMIESLKEQGCSVKINHERATDIGIQDALRRRSLPATFPKHEIKGLGFVVDPRGGRTVARIFRGDELIAEGIAICSPQDQFRKYEGSVKALGRAIAQVR